MTSTRPTNCGVAQIYEVIESSAAFYIVMEKVRGDDLYETLDHDGPMHPDDAKMVVYQILLATEHLHANSVIHKDLKLENVVLEKSPKLKMDLVKVIDFDTVQDWSPKSPK